MLLLKKALKWLKYRSVNLMNNVLGKTTKQRRWTNSSIDCYERGCICEGCIIDKILKNSPQKCQMKATVLELVREFGRPANTDNFKRNFIVG